MYEQEIEALERAVLASFNVRIYNYQSAFILDCIKHDRVVARWCRQTGKSTASAIFYCLYALSHPKSDILIVGPTDEHAGKIFDKIKSLLDFLDQKASIIESLTKRYTKLKNGSTIKAMTVGDKGISVRGSTAHVLGIEEGAYIKKSIYEQVLVPVVLATHGKIIESSTPFGKSGSFFQHCNNPSWKHHHLTWRDAVKFGTISEAEVELIKNEIDPIAFEAEYEALFVESAKNYFTYDEIRECIDEYKQIDERDLISLNAPPASYYLGVDLARHGSDSTVFTIIKKSENEEPNRVVFIKEIQNATIDKSVDYALWLHSKFNFRKIYADLTGLGAGFVDFLSKELNGSRLSTRLNTGFHEPSFQTDIVVGVTFSLVKKMEMYSFLKLQMQKKLIYYPAHPKLIQQLQQFEYEIIEGSRNMKLHHPEGHAGRDDFPDSLVLAMQGLRQPVQAVGILGEL